MSTDREAMQAADGLSCAPLLQGKRVAFLGKLGGLSRREAQRVVRQHGGIPVDRPAADSDLLIIGADELPLSDHVERLDGDVQQAVAEQRLEVLSETQFWQRLGLVEADNSVRRLYTPAMLAELVGVPLAVIRRWHRRKLIVPVREVHRLPYFDFQEVATARRLAQLLASGIAPAALEKKLAELARFLPGAERPLAQLSVMVEGKELLLRQGEGLLEPGGQFRIDFEAIEQEAPEQDASPDSLRLPDRPLAAGQDSPPTAEMLLEQAAELEDAGQLEAAAEWYRAALSAQGPQPDVCFQLAEVLYRLGDLSAARERYYMAIELHEDYVEARANLGCVLAETGQLELAAAAFEGALRYHPDYPDVHYHLARTLDELGRTEEAHGHWERFLELAPESPWAAEAVGHLQG